MIEVSITTRSDSDNSYAPTKITFQRYPHADRVDMYLTNPDRHIIVDVDELSRALRTVTEDS